MKIPVVVEIPDDLDEGKCVKWDSEVRIEVACPFMSYTADCNLYLLPTDGYKKCQPCVDAIKEAAHECKMYSNCWYGSVDEMGDIVCTNSEADPDYFTSYVSPDHDCLNWQPNKETENE